MSVTRIMLLSAASLSASGLAWAEPATCDSIPPHLEEQVPAARIISVGEDFSVSSRFCDGTAGHTSDVFVTLADAGLTYIATGHITATGEVIDLGVFTAGTELIFAIYVQDTGYWYYSGDASRNPDGLVHAAVTDLGNGSYVVGFEDLFGGGDRDYDDINLVIEADIILVEPCAHEGDADDDGVCDAADNCPLDANVLQEDVDGDGIGDACDDCNDVDADGACDDVDNCPGLSNDQADTDADGVGDACDDCLDVDQDAACDDMDNCPGVFNDQQDGDADGLGDACDACPADPRNDVDADGLCAEVDNCVAISNADQLDADLDGFGDVCDDCPFDPLDDADGDTYCADQDNCPLDPNEDQDDRDEDTVGDACDICPFDAADDADADGSCANEDTCPDVANPDQADSDGDGQGDACDVCPYDEDDDADADGICGDVDYCADTVLPDEVPLVWLGTNRWADLDGDGVFDTSAARGRGPRRAYTLADTAGCTCAQIIDELGLGLGHVKFGCSMSAMDDWVAHVATP